MAPHGRGRRGRGREAQSGWTDGAWSEDRHGPGQEPRPGAVGRGYGQGRGSRQSARPALTGQRELARCKKGTKSRGLGGQQGAVASSMLWPQKAGEWLVSGPRVPFQGVRCPRAIRGLCLATCTPRGSRWIHCEGDRHATQKHWLLSGALFFIF